MKVKIFLFTMALVLMCSVAQAKTDYVILQDSNSKDPLTIDSATNTVVTTTYAHHEKHNENDYYVADTAILGSDATLSFALTTPNTAKWAHMTWEINVTEPSTFQIWEDTTVSGMTSVVVPWNSDRNSLNTSGIIMSTGTTPYYSLGTKIFEEKWGYADTPSKTFGGGASHDSEIILKQDSHYVFLVWSQGADNIVSYFGNWYEHTNKE